jgi:PLP dependent protein
MARCFDIEPSAQGVAKTHFLNHVILLIDIMFSIADKLENVRNRIQKTTKELGRSDSSVLLLPVSKKQSAEAVLEAYAAGADCFGENYLSEALEKQARVSQIDPSAASKITWHFIGPIQSNKTRSIAESFSWVESLDRQKIAQRLNDHRPENLPPLNVCIQVNIDEEDTKSGVSLAQVEQLAEFVQTLPRLTLRGLMTIPSAAATELALDDSMRRVKECFDVLANKFDSIDTLSMGMSGDMDLAIKNGSTMVRVGTAIFGARS